MLESKEDLFSIAQYIMSDSKLILKSFLTLEPYYTMQMILNFGGLKNTGPLPRNAYISQLKVNYLTIL
jgi:hypothetical protein